MLEQELSYYRHRAETEVELAAHATHPKVVAAHYHLANAYLERMSAAEAQQQTDHG